MSNFGGFTPPLNLLWYMDPLSIAAIALPFIGGLFSNIFGAASNSSSNKLRMEMFNKQLQYNTAMWNATNAYNDPSEQRQRLEKAGLNPFFGSVTPGIATSSPTAPAAPIITPNQFSNPLATTGSDINNARMIPTTLEQARLQNRRSELENNMLAVDSKYKLAKTLAELDQLRNNARGTEVDNQLKDIQREIMERSKNSQVEKYDVDLELAKAQRDSAQKMLPFLDSIQAATVAKLRAEAANIAANTGLTGLQAKKVIQETLNLNTVLEGMKIDNNQKQILQKYIIDGADADNEYKRELIENARKNRKHMNWMEDFEERKYDNRYLDTFVNGLLGRATSPF